MAKVRKFKFQLRFHVGDTVYDTFTGTVKQAQKRWGKALDEVCGDCGDNVYATHWYDEAGERWRHVLDWSDVGEVD